MRAAVSRLVPPPSCCTVMRERRERAALTTKPRDSCQAGSRSTAESTGGGAMPAPGRSDRGHGVSTRIRPRTNAPPGRASRQSIARWASTPARRARRTAPLGTAARIRAKSAGDRVTRAARRFSSNRRALRVPTDSRRWPAPSSRDMALADCRSCCRDDSLQSAK